jgi:NADH-quinone oxidoreductase subunit G
MPALTIDGQEITVERGTTVIQAADRLGIAIPSYCYHPGLPIAGNCRICMVEIEKFPKLQIACYTPAQDGMVVRTNTEAVKATQRHILEFLLINHPLDCPVCDQAGECRLQDYYMRYGLYDSRFNDTKVKKKKAVSIGPTVMLDTERCILCSRCVRFTDEITKTGEFGIMNRGDHAEIGLYPGKALENKYSGNVVDICPVGALTDKDFRFKCRVWYLESSPSVCPGCSMGCNIDIHYQLERTHIAAGERVMRLKPRENPEVNKWWMCDEGRYGYKFIDHERILRPVMAREGEHEECGWEEALDAAAGKMREIPKSQWAVLASPKLTNEELYLVKRVFGDSLGLRIYGISPTRKGASDDFLLKADKNPNTRGAIELAIETSPAELEHLVASVTRGETTALYVFGQDLYELLQEETCNKIFKECFFLIFQGSNWNRTARQASVVLPAATYAEKDGTFTNYARRVQSIFKAFAPKGESRPDWEILVSLSRRLDFPLPYKGPWEIFEEMARSGGAFRGLSHDAVGMQGKVLA